MAFGDDWDADKMLALYIYNYMKKRNLHEAADIFAKEANLPMIPLVDSPEGLLKEWWEVFWPAYISNNRNDPNANAVSLEKGMHYAAVFSTIRANFLGAGSSQETMFGHMLPPFPPIMDQQWAGNVPAYTDFNFDNMFWQPAASLSPTLGIDQLTLANYSLDTDCGNTMASQAETLLPSPVTDKDGVDKLPPEFPPDLQSSQKLLDANNGSQTVVSLSNDRDQRLQATTQFPMQVSRDYGNDIALGGSTQMESTLLAGPSSTYRTTGLHDAGMDQSNSEKQLTGEPSNEANAFSSSKECQVPDWYLKWLKQQYVHVEANSEQHDLLTSVKVDYLPNKDTPRLTFTKLSAGKNQPERWLVGLENPEKGTTSSTLLAGKTPLVDTNMGFFLPKIDENPDNKKNFSSALQQSSATGEFKLEGFSFEEVGSFSISRDKFLCCDYSSDGRYIACAGLERKVTVWNTDNYHFVNDWEGHFNIITDIRFKPNSVIFATSSFDKTVQIWDAESPSKSLNMLSGHAEPVMSVDFHPRKVDLLCSCDRNGEMRLWDVDQNSCVWISKGASRKVRFQPEVGNLLATAAGNAVNLIDVESSGLYFQLEGHVNEIRSICWDTSGMYIASVSEDCARIWSPITGKKCIAELPSNGKKFESCIFHPSYSQLLVIGSYQTLEMWNPTGNNETLSFKTHDNIICGLAVAPTRKLITSIGHDRWMKVWK